MYEEELKFLNEFNDNIIRAELCDVKTKDGVETGIVITVGQTNEEYSDVISNLESGESVPVFEGREIIFTARHLSKILKLTKEYSNL